MDTPATGFLRVPLVYRLLAAAATVGAAIGILELIGPTVNAATAAQILLLVVLIDARFFGIQPALLASLLSAAGFLRYFVTPTGLTFGDPNDIADLAAFVIMAVVGGELAVRAERRAREVEHLYEQLQAAFERESEAEASRRTERVKATLLDAMAHNLRTPLTAIKAAVTAILGGPVVGVAPLSRDEEREMLSVIDEETDRLNQFIGGLVTPQQVAGPERPALHSAAIADVVDAAVARAEMLTRDHRVKVQLARGLPRVRVDARSATEVFYILLDNASKYAPRGTTIRVLAQASGDAFVTVTVSDEGPGIAPVYRERVFERFFRIPNRESHDPSRSGGGVGLSLAKRLVETQGGTISIDTPAAGLGTIVAVALPVGDVQ